MLTNEIHHPVMGYNIKELSKNRVVNEESTNKKKKIFFQPEMLWGLFLGSLKYSIADYSGKGKIIRRCP